MWTNFWKEVRRNLLINLYGLAFWVLRGKLKMLCTSSKEPMENTL